MFSKNFHFSQLLLFSPYQGSASHRKGSPHWIDPSCSKMPSVHVFLHLSRTRWLSLLNAFASLQLWARGKVPSAQGRALTGLLLGINTKRELVLNHSAGVCSGRAGRAGPGCPRSSEGGLGNVCLQRTTLFQERPANAWNVQQWGAGQRDCGAADHKIQTLPYVLIMENWPQYIK